MENKQLLIEHRLFVFSKEQINESLQKNNGKLIVQGILTTRNEEKNQNGRIYPKRIIEREVGKYIDERIKQKRATGELDHPNSNIINLKNVSHHITDAYWNGDNLIGTVEILTTPSGNILRELFKCGVAVGISSRALGSVKTIDESTVEVQDDLQLLAWDFVSDPSVANAWMKPLNSINENVEYNMMDKYGKINSLIHDILSEIK